MKYKVKPALLLFAIVVCFSILGFKTEAAGPRDGEIVDGSLLTSDSSVRDSFQVNLRGAILAAGSTQLESKHGGVIYVSVETFAFQTCDRLNANLYLERLNGNEWEHVSQRLFSNQNSYYLSDGVLLTVAQGYYYRLRGSHAATKGNINEDNATLTNGIYIG